MNQHATRSLAVIFDIDGVLINTEPAHTAAHAAVAELYGFTPAEMKATKVRGSSLHDHYHALQQVRPFAATFASFSETVLAALFEQLNIYDQKPDPGLVPLLRALKQQRIPVGVGTSALRQSAKRKLAAVKLEDVFDVLIASDDVERAKPEPDIYLAVARLLKVNPEYCVVIEDAAAGIQAGKAAGMKTIGYTTYTPEPEKLHEADLRIHSFNELSVEGLYRLVQTKSS